MFSRVVLVVVVVRLLGLVQGQGEFLSVLELLKLPTATLTCMQVSA